MQQTDWIRVKAALIRTGLVGHKRAFLSEFIDSGAVRHMHLGPRRHLYVAAVDVDRVAAQLAHGGRNERKP